MSRPLGRWETEAKNHLLKYRPKMAKQLRDQGKLDDWAKGVAEKAKNQYAESVESEAKRNHMLLPSEEDQPNMGESPQAIPDPASLVTAESRLEERSVKTCPKIPEIGTVIRHAK